YPITEDYKGTKFWEFFAWTDRFFEHFAKSHKQFSPEAHAKYLKLRTRARGKEQTLTVPDLIEKMDRLMSSKKFDLLEGRYVVTQVIATEQEYQCDRDEDDCNSLVYNFLELTKV